MNSFMSSRIAISAAVVGLVGAAGLYIYEQIKSANRRAHVEMAALRGQVNTLQTDLESLKRLQTQIHSQEEARSKKFKKVPNRKRPTVAPSNAGDTSIGDISYTSDSDFHTVIDTDTENEDNFFDINSDDESSHDSDKTMVPSDAGSTRFDGGSNYETNYFNLPSFDARCHHVLISTNIHTATPFSHEGRQKQQPANRYDPYTPL